MFITPAIAFYIKPPGGQQFSVIYLLDSNHTLSNLPFNIKAGIVYSVYLGVQNDMASPEYYTCSVKLGNQTAPLPDATLGTASSLPALYEYKTFVSAGGTWEAPLTFQVDNLAFTKSECRLSGITINGIDHPVSVTTALDSKQTGFYYNLFAELSLYNSTLGTIQYNDRYVNLILNMVQ